MSVSVLFVDPATHDAVYSVRINSRKRRDEVSSGAGQAVDVIAQEKLIAKNKRTFQVEGGVSQANFIGPIGRDCGRGLCRRGTTDQPIVGRQPGVRTVKP